MPRMNYWHTTFAILAVVASIALAEESKTSDGKETNRAKAVTSNTSATNAQQPNWDLIVRIGLEYYSPEEIADDERHGARKEGSSATELEEAIAKIPAGGICDMELYADSVEAANPKRLTYVILDSTGKEIERRKGKLIGSAKSSVSYWWRGGDQIDLPAIKDSLRLRIYDEVSAQTLGDYVFRPKRDPDRVCCDKFLPPPGERGVRSKILQ